eukprot:725376-Amphidinium_carterae.1
MGPLLLEHAHVFGVPLPSPAGSNSKLAHSRPSSFADPLKPVLVTFLPTWTVSLLPPQAREH